MKPKTTKLAVKVINQPKHGSKPGTDGQADGGRDETCTPRRDS